MKALQVKTAPPGVVVCACHRHLVEGYRWYINAGGKKPYAMRGIKKNGKVTAISMGRTVLEAKPGERVMYLNGNTLDNRCINVIKATARENSRYRGPSRSKLIPYKGVYPKGEGYVASIGQGRKDRWLGTFTTAEEAARAYNREAAKRYGRFAKLNKIS